MLALLYRVTPCGVYIVSTSREKALEQAKEYSDADDPELEYLGRVANLSLGDPEATYDELRDGLHDHSEVNTNPEC